MRMLTDNELAQLAPAEDMAAPTPLPMQVVSSDEFFPIPQTPRQKQVEARLNELADTHGRSRGLSRRAFFKTASGAWRKWHMTHLGLEGEGGIHMQEQGTDVLQD